jgi:hybrid cluster-associated redox disulfide protein
LRTAPEIPSVNQEAGNFPRLATGEGMITKDMIIGDIIRSYPATISVFEKHQLDCFECQIADLETLEHGAGVHKINVDQLLIELNLNCTA